MIIVDSSALIAILLNEPEPEIFFNIINLSDEALISSAILVEASVVMESRNGIVGVQNLDDLISQLKLEIISFTPEQAEIAIKAFRTYGKGRHPASLNICDCYSYALAKYYNSPLLFKGNDFSQTDIACADKNLV